MRLITDLWPHLDSCCGSFHYYRFRMIHVVHFELQTLLLNGRGWIGFAFIRFVFNLRSHTVNITCRVEWTLINLYRIHFYTHTYLALISSNRIIKIFKPFILFHSINHVQLLFVFFLCATSIFAYHPALSGHCMAWRNFSSTDFSCHYFASLYLTCCGSMITRPIQFNPHICSFFCVFAISRTKKNHFNHTINSTQTMPITVCVSGANDITRNSEFTK